MALATLRGGPWAWCADHCGAGAGAGGIEPRATGGGVLLELDAAFLAGRGRRATGAGAGGHLPQPGADRSAVEKAAARCRGGADRDGAGAGARSEEHTFELPALK